MVAWQVAVRGAVQKTISSRRVSGIVVAVATGGGPAGSLAIGNDADGRSLNEGSLLPVASVTKLATALAVLRLVGAGKLALDDPLGKHASEAAAARNGVTLRSMLCHTAGLPNDVEPRLAPYRRGLSWPVLARACIKTPSSGAPAKRVAYSNVGPGLLAVVVERATGRTFNAALDDLVLRPLGIEAYLGVEPMTSPARIDGTLGEHAETDLEPYNSSFWRALALPWGGMVTNAAGALSLVRAFAGVPAGFLPEELRREATSDQTDGLGGGMIGLLEFPRCPWGLGVELRGDKTPHWTPKTASSESFGHAGASGALVWHDPRKDISWAMLGTRTFDGWWQSWPAIGEAVLAATGSSAG